MISITIHVDWENLFFVNFEPMFLLPSSLENSLFFSKLNLFQTRSSGELEETLLRKSIKL